MFSKRNVGAAAALCLALAACGGEDAATSTSTPSPVTTAPVTTTETIPDITTTTAEPTTTTVTSSNVCAEYGLTAEGADAEGMQGHIDFYLKSEPAPPITETMTDQEIIDLMCAAAARLADGEHPSVALVPVLDATGLEWAINEERQRLEYGRQVGGSECQSLVTSYFGLTYGIALILGEEDPIGYYISFPPPDMSPYSDTGSDRSC